MRVTWKSWGAVATAALLITLSDDALSAPGRVELEEAQRLSWEVIQLYDQGRYREAVPLAKRVLTITEEALGKRHLVVASRLNNLASLYQKSVWLAHSNDRALAMAAWMFFLLVVAFAVPAQVAPWS